ncbi:hypothetical protein [Paenibacillus graminis]|uniref:hypothetical protein n=1 Tax=Paenibacillus graminis TaxID=189425 RepID=UPI0030EDBB3C
MSKIVTLFPLGMTEGLTMGSPCNAKLKSNMATLFGNKLHPGHLKLHSGHPQPHV